MEDHEKYKALMMQAAGRIQDPDIHSFVKQALNGADEKFFTYPSSSSGKYHPPESLGIGGIARHSIKAAEVSSCFSEMYMLSEEGRDMAFAAALLHDICKYGNPWGESIDDEHGLVGYYFLSTLEMPGHKKLVIIDAVRYHMGLWVRPESETMRSLSPTRIEHIVQLSDYIVSQKCASFLPGIDLDESVITKYADLMLKK